MKCQSLVSGRNKKNISRCRLPTFFYPAFQALRDTYWFSDVNSWKLTRFWLCQKGPGLAAPYRDKFINQTIIFFFFFVFSTLRANLADVRLIFVLLIFFQEIDFDISGELSCKIWFTWNVKQSVKKKWNKRNILTFCQLPFESQVVKVYHWFLLTANQKEKDSKQI